MERTECNRMYVAVVENGSFSKAARQLGVSAAKASKLVSALESDLGVQLLARTTRALSVTDVGQLYFERVQDLLQQMDELDNLVQHSSGSPSGPLRITAPVSFGVIQLAPALESFALKYPDIHLDVDFSDRLVNLIDEGFDLALRIGVPADSQLMARKLGSARVITLASPGYIEENGAPQIPDDLTQHACIIDSNICEPTRWLFSAGDYSKTITVKSRIRLSSPQATLSAAMAGLGIARVPSFIASDALEKGQVVPLLSDYEGDAFGIYLMYPATRHVLSRIRLLIDYLVDHFSDPIALE